jgi:hypothetical protein
MFQNPRTPRPCPVPRAEWQPGVIAGSEKQRVYLDGEPVVGAIAASYVEGWVIVSVGRGRNDDDDHLILYPTRAGQTRTLKGYVEIREATL